MLWAWKRKHPLALEEQVSFALSFARPRYRRGLPAIAGADGPDPSAVSGDARPVAARAAVGPGLGGLLQLDPGTLSPLLKRLEAVGYVHRQRDPADERSLAVTLTTAGQALRADAERIPPAIVERLGMPISELATCTPP